MDKKLLINLAVKFFSRRILAIGSVLYAAIMDVALSKLICLAVVASVYIICVTFGPNKENGTVNNSVSAPAGPVAVLLVCLLLMGSIFAPSAKADILPFIDTLDLQAGPGLEVIDWKPFTIKECVVATAKIPKLEYGKIHFRVGGLLNDIRSALVLSINRSLTDVVVRNDDGTQKVLLPTIGVWGSGYRIDELQEDGTIKKVLKFTVGINACYEY